MTVDLSKIKPGDEVTVRCVVLNAQPDHDGDIKGDFGAGEDGDCPMHFKPDRIVSHTPKALAVGDRVKDGAFQAAVKATVLFADERDVVIRTDEGGIHSGPADGDWVKRLERADD